MATFIYNKRHKVFVILPQIPLSCLIIFLGKVWSFFQIHFARTGFGSERIGQRDKINLSLGVTLKGSVCFVWESRRQTKKKEKKMMKFCPCFSNPQQLPNSPRDSFDEGLTGYRGHSNKLFALFTFRSRGKGIHKRCLFLHTNKSSQVFLIIVLVCEHGHIQEALGRST